MKIVSFTRGDARERTGALIAGGELVLDFTSPAVELPPLAHPLEVFDLDGPFLAAARALAARAVRDGELTRLRESGAALALDHVQLLAPVPRPGKILCIGRNYREHAAESSSPLPERPLLFSKFSSCASAPGATIRIPRGSSQLDYEAELAVVIGRTAHAVSRETALDYVAGYTLFNDGSIRDYQRRTHQWTLGKNFDRTGPLGPELVTADELPPGATGLRIEMRVNGEVRQSATTTDMIFGVAETIATITEAMTLQPGDVIAMGTPSGVGGARTPPVFLRAGDVCEVEIERIGILRNVVTEATKGSS